MTLTDVDQSVEVLTVSSGDRIEGVAAVMGGAHRGERTYVRGATAPTKNFEVYLVVLRSSSRIAVILAVTGLTSVS